MKAIVYHTYGSPDVLHLADVPQPAPARGEILVQVRAASVGYGEVAVRNFASISPREFNMPSLFWLLARFSFGLRKPANPILGNEFAGVVAAIGEGVTRFKVGDAVFGYRGQMMGTYAEYLCLPADGMVAPLPPQLGFIEAAVVPYGALTALTLLRRLNIQPGQRVLVNGASGRIGTFALQIARHLGAEVTAVCGTARVDYVRALGARRVLDYTRDDFTRDDTRYDFILDILGRSSFAACRRVLTPQGVYFPISFKLPAVLAMLRTRGTAGQRVHLGISDEKPADMATIASMVAAGTLTAQVDRSFPLAEAAAAHRYYESAGRAGNVALVVAE
ncbi:MAG: NAD(P)-dependent alcohol dehydrogenase [Anaerolineae bacterium]|jgi:NADPH:quinone reductase-like Zn-dependent oxidoreductase|nr:NAD(P)-dependent alcohol dehydrogenase [Anaerolineae bacterium]